jgi:two-component system sensor histidine kinase UhpB
MTTELERQLIDLKQGDHICRIYETMAEQMAGAVPFLKEGLAQGERCLYIADDRAAEAIAPALAAAGVDVAHERERGALWMPTKQDSYLKGGKFDPRAMIDFMRSAQTQALADGFPGLRVAGEMTWALGPEIGCDPLIEYEALFNDFMANSRTIGLCQYHHSRFDPAVIHDVLRTHPITILGDLVYPNPYYEPPELVLSPEPQASGEFKRKRVAWWIAQLKRARAGEQERERALEKLKLSERRLAEAQKVAHIGSWERDLRTNQVTWSDELYPLFGLKAHEIELSYQQFLNLVLPHDVDRIRVLVDKAIRERRPFNFDYRIRLANGGVRVLNDRGSLILDAEGEPIRLVGTAQDVTELRQAEQAQQEYAARLQTLSRRLLEVQEEERRHLARELHDEFGQILATITLHLHAALGLAGDAARSRLDECATLLHQAGEQVRSLALELRPTMLDTLGLEATLRWLAEHHQQRTGCEVQVVGHLSGTPLSPELAIACFRVVQEALTNVVRHAAARHVWIEVSQSDSVLELVVRDDGMGFDVAATQEQAARRGRLGLLGMAERVHLLGGSLDVESEPGRGTRIRAAFPSSETSAQPADPAE